MRLTDLLDEPVVSRADATELGRVDQVVVDAAGHRITGLVLRGGDVVPVEAATIGPDSVMVDDRSVVAEPGAFEDGTEPAERPHGAKRPTLLGARALAETGDELGTVTDLDVDASDGTIIAVLLGDGSVAGEALIGVGGYAVVLAVTTGPAPAGTPAPAAT
jgi:sporulation protein YlmC with PRC-barrel domain